MSTVAATTNLYTLREKLCQPLNANTLLTERIIDELISDTSGGIMENTGGRFYG